MILTDDDPSRSLRAPPPRNTLLSGRNLPIVSLRLQPPLGALLSGRNNPIVSLRGFAKQPPGRFQGSYDLRRAKAIRKLSQSQVLPNLPMLLVNNHPSQKLTTVSEGFLQKLPLSAIDSPAQMFYIDLMQTPLVSPSSHSSPPPKSLRFWGRSGAFKGRFFGRHCSFFVASALVAVEGKG